jgi:hypothetical protein
MGKMGRMGRMGRIGKIGEMGLDLAEPFPFSSNEAEQRSTYSSNLQFVPFVTTRVNILKSSGQMKTVANFRKRTPRDLQKMKALFPRSPGKAFDNVCND